MANEKSFGGWKDADSQLYMGAWYGKARSIAEGAANGGNLKQMVSAGHGNPQTLMDRVLEFRYNDGEDLSKPVVALLEAGYPLDHHSTNETPTGYNSAERSEQDRTPLGAVVLSSAYHHVASAKGDDWEPGVDLMLAAGGDPSAPTNAKGENAIYIAHYMSTLKGLSQEARDHAKKLAAYLKDISTGLKPRPTPAMLKEKYNIDFDLAKREQNLKLLAEKELQGIKGEFEGEKTIPVPQVMQVDANGRKMLNDNELREAMANMTMTY